MELPASRSGDSVWFRRTHGGVFSVPLTGRGLKEVRAWSVLRGFSPQPYQTADRYPIALPDCDRLDGVSVSPPAATDRRSATSMAFSGLI
ncbi:MAG: hypothetical protein AAGI14_01500 [Pseudomonadota bacterium]